MKKSTRAEIARETVEICEAGAYRLPDGRTVQIGESIRRARDGTVLYTAASVTALAPTLSRLGRIEVTDESTFLACQRLSGEAGHLGCLDFASAKNPGGGFLGGAQAQEESLARSSALYPCLLTQPAYYEQNRANRSTIYLDLVIYSPHVPFFRNDEGSLLGEAIPVSVITAPAPNAGAVKQNEPQNAPLIEPALHRRAELVLRIANAQAITHLVLGAWGCGVFRNDPGQVAACFASLLRTGGPFCGAFEHVVFAVLDRMPERATYEAFRAAFS